MPKFQFIDADTLSMKSRIDRVGDQQMFLSPPRHHPENGRYKDEEYLKWIRKFPCTVCGTPFNIEAHHHWKTRWNDFTAIPLCVSHHEFGIHASTDQKEWQEKKGVDLEQEIMRFNMLYIAMLKGLIT